MDKIYFYKTDQAFGFLNNYYGSRMFVFGRWWNNVEAPYQAMKCANPSDIDAIHKAESPKEARELGQKVKIVPGWDEIKMSVMYQCVLAKFTQNHELLQQLLMTGEREIIENSQADAFWGCGPNKDGQNMLGKILMDVRKELKGF